MRSGLRLLLGKLPICCEAAMPGTVPERLGCSVLLKRMFAADAPAAATISEVAKQPLPTFWGPGLDALGAKLSTEEAKREFSALKGVFMDMQREMAAAKVETKFDWDSLKDKVDPDLIDMFKEQIAYFESIPYANEDVIREFSEKAKIITERVNAQMDELDEELRARVAHLREEVKQIELELALIDHMTMDQALALDPELAKEIDEEISQNKWF